MSEVTYIFSLKVTLTHFQKTILQRHFLLRLEFQFQKLVALHRLQLLLSLAQVGFGQEVLADILLG